MADMAMLILAAGASQRFNGCKLLTEIDGKTMLQHAIDKAQQACPGHVYAVTGAWHRQIVNSQQRGDIQHVKLLQHQHWQLGLASSLARGIEALAQHYQAIFVMLADQMAMTAAQLLQMKKQYRHNILLCARYQQHRGVPVIFPACCYDELIAFCQQTSDPQSGARKFLAQYQAQLQEVSLTSAGIDIDTRQDLARFSAIGTTHVK